MAVGVEDHGRPEAARADLFGNPLTLVAGVDNHQLAGSGVAEKNAVGLDGTHRKNVEKN